MGHTLANETTRTQCGEVLRYMEERGSITQAEAASELGCWRLGARIWDLKNRGHAIRSEIVTKKNRYGRSVHFAKYSIIKNQEGTKAWK